MLLEDQDPNLCPSNVINTISVNPLEDTLMITTHIPQLYSVTLWGPDMTRLPEIIVVNILSQSYGNLMQIPF